MKTIVIIQARMGSTRLPGKILMPLGELDVLSYVTARCNKIKGVTEVIVATSTLPQDDAVENWCNEHNVSCFRGSEDNVLDRFVQSAKRYEPDYVMRVTSDCPFVDFEMASNLIELMEHERKDIVLIDGQLPRGLAVELISYEALLRIYRSELEERHREHVTYYAYEFSDQFESVTYIAPKNRVASELRITLDMDADYELCQAVAGHFNDIYVSSADVIEYLLENPEVARLNAHIEQKPVM
ncbi:glycosyltransferase family protein [Psychrobacillus sp.]|uniref:glycosyltransferase family protein n=1 Tax=Psychrobacillus sp. TaxID=1871623 RepID=UPI0028BDBE6D|nr:glycosyltransferase family protein [Psychrobacillus sp.]